MAKTKSSGMVRYLPAPRQQMPIIKVSAPRAAPMAKKHHRRHAGGSSKKKVIAVAVAGYVMGHIDKAGTAIPTVPMLGRAGTIAAVAYFFGKGQGIWGDVMVAAAAIAGYEMGSTGKIAGGQIASQVHGIAAQT